jgi:ferritin
MEKKLVDQLNKQINEEMHSAYIYAAMAADFEFKNLKGMANWMNMQAQEEMMHAQKFYTFLLDRGEKVIFETIEAPKAEYGSPKEAFETSLAHEKHITSCIHNLVRLSREVGDIPTETFLSWFVTEQVEEEANVDEIIAKFEMVGESMEGLYLLDKELSSRTLGAGE